MNIKVMYHSSTGNTEKVARAIASALDVQAEPIKEGETGFSEPVDLLFIGDGIYAGKAHKNTVAFIDRLDPGTVRNTAVFATYGGQAAIGGRIKQLLTEKGLKVVGEPFTCKGKAWVVANRKHPDEADLGNAREFAKSVVAKVKEVSVEAAF